MRKNLGYVRLDIQKQADLVNELFRGPLRDYINFFLPSAKCTERKRIGSKIVKKYDNAQTPYERMLEQECVSEEMKTTLKKHYAELNPVALRKEVAMLKRTIFRS